jgi:hypothetical protein
MRIYYRRFPQTLLLLYTDLEFGEGGDNMQLALCSWVKMPNSKNERKQGRHKGVKQRLWVARCICRG